MISGSVEEMTEHIIGLWFRWHGGVQINIRFDDLGGPF